VSAPTGRLIRVFSGPRYEFDAPEAVAVDGPDVWVINAGSDSVTEFTP
jgi:hypothetical protein